MVLALVLGLPLRALLLPLLQGRPSHFGSRGVSAQKSSIWVEGALPTNSGAVLALSHREGALLAFAPKAEVASPCPVSR